MKQAMTAVWCIATVTCQEALRQRFVAAIALLAAAFCASALFLLELDLGGAQQRFVSDVGFGAMSFFAAILAVAVPAHSLFAEFDQRTAQAVLAKPVARASFLCGKLLGTLGLLTAFCLLLTALIAVLLSLTPSLENAPQVNWPGVWLAGLLQWVKAAVLASLTLLIATYARSSLFAVLAGCAAWAGGQLQHLAHHAWAEATNPLGRALGWLVARLLPDLQAFDVSDLLVMQSASGLSGGALLSLGIYGCLYLLLYLACACWLFNQREL